MKHYPDTIAYHATREIREELTILLKPPMIHNMRETHLSTRPTVPAPTAVDPCFVTAFAISVAALAPKDWIRRVAPALISSKPVSMSSSYLSR